MLIYSLSILSGLTLLIWSANKFIDGSTSIAKYYGMPPLLIGMVIIGFGTSTPELLVSAMASFQNNSGIALGNAYGSNIVNIALILGVTALLKPILVHSTILKKELPILTLITVLSGMLLMDLKISRQDSIILLLAFAGLMFWTVKNSFKSKDDAIAIEVESELIKVDMSRNRSLLLLFGGLLLLIISSRMLVYGAVGVAQALDVSDVFIGLTIVAAGTSLPELASSIVAALKNEPDIALGNILGSNLFNTMAVVGLAGIIHPMEVDKDVFSRDFWWMMAATVSLFIFCYRHKKPGKINRFYGGILFLSYCAYLFILLRDASSF